MESDLDPLTGAASRTAFIDRLARATAVCHAREEPLSIALLDCDHFKGVNDSFGHVIGDDVLRDVAQVLTQIHAPGGCIARLWGDAFGILLPREDAAAVRAQLEAAHRGLNARMAQRDWPVTFSIGAVTFARPAGPPRDLLQAADAVMHSVKRGGRNALACRVVASGRAESVLPLELGVLSVTSSAGNPAGLFERSTH